MTLFVVAIATFLATDHSDANGEEIRPITSWSGKTTDETHKNAKPENGIITDQASWKTLWNKWHPGQALPRIDFANDIVLVDVVSGPNRMSAGRLILSEGDVAFHSLSTRMGGPGFGHLCVQISRKGIKSVNGQPVPANEVSDSVTVEIVGTLRTGIMAIGGESTGTIISAGNITWELQLNADQLKKAETLNQSKVRVRGVLTKKAGVEIAERWIVEVESIESAKPSPNQAKFQVISVVKSGGFAGIHETMKLNPDGTLTSESRRNGRVQGEVQAHTMQAIRQLISETDWNSIPKSTREENIADAFQFQITVDLGDKQFAFTIDDHSLVKVPALQKLLQLIN